MSCTGCPDPRTYYRPITTPLFSQGDIFLGVPLPVVADPDLIGIDTNLSMLITPTTAIRARGATNPAAYMAPHVTVVPVLRLPIPTIRDYPTLAGQDELLHYMYLPADPLSRLPESVAVLSMPITMPLSYLLNEEVTRIAQLGREGLRQLQNKLVWWVAGGERLAHRCQFDPPMD
jgi:hypothetical protein